MRYEGGEDRSVGDASLAALNHEAYARRHEAGDEPDALARRAFAAAAEAGDDYHRALAMRTLACRSYQSGKSDGFEGALEALTVLEAHDDPLALATTHNVIACYHFLWGQYDLLFERLKTTFDLAVAAGDRRTQALAITNMAVAAEKVGDLPEAVQQYERALELWTELEDETWIFVAEGFMGHVHQLAGEPDRGLPLLERAYEGLAARESEGRRTTEMAAHLAACLAALGRFEEAERLAERATEWCERGEHALIVASVHLTLGEVRAQRGDDEGALSALLVAREMANVHDSTDGMRETLKLLAETARRLGRPEEALGYLLEYVDARETLFSAQAEQRTRTMQVLHRVEMTQKEANLARQQNEELQALNKRLVATLGEKDALHAELMRHAVTDELTGVSNRRHVIEFGRREFERHRRLDAPLSIVMLDVDHFKRVNDRFGHAAGDEVLRLVARTCGEGVRAIDAFGRWGGEEFCIVLPGARAETARRIAERIRETVEELPFGDILAGGSVTVSLGLAEVGPLHRSLDDLLSDADQALYAAKRAGRNRVLLAPERVATAA